MFGLDAIKKFNLIQEENLKIKQKIDDKIIHVNNINKDNRQ